MSMYRRVYIPGGTYFFTVVTHARAALFADAVNITLLGEAMRTVRASRPFTLDAVVVLPDHVHCVMRMPDNDADFSSRWREIKKYVSRRVASVQRFWQPRFWEHALRDEADWRNHMDYVHFNPVKHGFVTCAADWPWSSLRQAVNKGWYPPGWGCVAPEAVRD